MTFFVVFKVDFQNHFFQYIHISIFCVCKSFFPIYSVMTAGVVIHFHFIPSGFKSLLSTPESLSVMIAEDAVMTSQELRKLSRKDLLELLIAQGRERDALQTELERAKAALQSRQLQVEQAGSIAEAALQVNGVFEAAQAAAQQYLENIRQRSAHVEEICAQREAACARQEAEVRQRIDRQLSDAAKAAQEMEEETRRKCQSMEAEARENSEAYWAETTMRLRAFYQEYEELKRLLSAGGER